MEELIKVLALGGLDENGKSLYVLDYNNQIYIFDAGLRYPEESLLGVDVILPSYQYLIDNKDRIVAFFLSHGHDENIGSLPFILENLGPEVHIYGTKYTILSLKIFAKRFKKKMENAIFHEIGVDEDFVVNGVNMYSFAITHGSPYSCGFAFETLRGLIVYSGDFIISSCESKEYATNLTRICELAKKGTLLLMSESYNASYPGFVCPNHKISNKIQQLLEEVKGRLFIATYGQTIYQLKEILEIAIKNKRRVYLYSQLTKDTIANLKDNYKDFIIPDNLFTDNIYERDCIVIISELGNKLFNLLEEIAESNETEFSYKINQFDSFVLLSAPHSGTERAFAKILDKLFKTNAQVINLTKEIVSMHAGAEDLKQMLSLFKPKYYMPIRGYYIKLIDNAKIALSLGYDHSNILVYDNGMFATFSNGLLSNLYQKMDLTEVMVDGIGIGDVGNVVINDRRKLSNDGVIIIGLSFSMATRKIVAGPDISTRGFIVKANGKELTNKISKCFQKACHDIIIRPGLVDFNEVRNHCKEEVSALIKKEIDREPMILPVIISV